MDIIQFLAGLFWAAIHSPWSWAAWAGLLIFGWTWVPKVDGVGNTIWAAYINDLQTKKVDTDGATPLALPPLHKTDNYIVLTSDFGKIITMTAAILKTFTLPSIDASHIGYQITFVKLGAGALVIARADADTINGGTTVTNPMDDDLYSVIRLRVLTATIGIIDSMTNPMGWVIS